VAGASLVLALVWSWRTWSAAPRTVAGIIVEGDALAARGLDGKAVWRYPLGRPLIPVDDPGLTIHEAADLDGDGVPEHLVNVPWKSEDSPIPGELFCFSALGKPLWSVRLSNELAFRAGRYGPPWVSPHPTWGSKVAAYQVGGVSRVAWIQNHRLWWPGMLTILDSRGRPISKWIHAGNLQGVAFLAGDPPLLLLAGTSNSRAAAFLAVLDARNVTGSGPEEVGSPYECLSCDVGQPLRYFVFPPSELTRAILLPYNHGFDVRVLEDGIEVHTAEGEPRFRLYGIFRFSLDLELRHAAWSDGWLPAHRVLEREGKLDHGTADCPEGRRPPRVMEWESGELRELEVGQVPTVQSTLASRR
jgi:hypothetical protein